MNQVDSPDFQRIGTLLVSRLLGNEAALVDQDRDQYAIRGQNADLLIDCELGHSKLLNYWDTKHIFFDDGVLLSVVIINLALGLLIIKVEYSAIFTIVFDRIWKVWKTNN